jgi:FAD/FMN-containing dehydrogenase
MQEQHGLPIDTGPGEVESLRNGLRGDLLRPGDPGYDDARKLYNGIIDKRPALIARCLSVDDIVHCVNFAREHDIELSVRGGGHGVAGKALCDNGLVIDLSRMRGVKIDPGSKRALVEPGARWKELDSEAQRYGLATTGGRVSSTGVAGFTLGGGAGWLMGRFGLACDNLVSADVVTAEGEVVRASDQENTDLLWALRGGGGNFGVVSSFEFSLHPIEMTLSGLLAWPRTKAVEVLNFFREFALRAPDDLGLVFACVTGQDGLPAVTVTTCWIGDMEEGKRILKPLRDLASPSIDTITEMRYDQVQQMLEYTGVWGSRNHWKSGFIPELTAASMRTILDHTEDMPSRLSAIHLWHHHGAANRVAEDETAFPNRSYPFNIHIIGAWEDPGEDAAGVQWARGFWQDMTPHFANRAYVNFDDLKDPKRIRSAYGPNYERLVRVKTKFDPTNMFRSNQNIQPTRANLD